VVEIRAHAFDKLQVVNSRLQVAPDVIDVH
jgi:hypothetical protein